MDVAAWLRELGLERYQPVFRDHEIDWDILPELNEEDLEKLGIPLGARKRLLKAIAALSAGAPGRQEITAAPSREAERRQLTVMFVDLVGSTELAARLDPEDTSALIRAYQNAVAGEITRFEGHIAKYMGDGVLAYFGWPRAHEDEAERAVRAGLAIIEGLAGLKTPSGEPLAARIGIATGAVVVGELIGEGAAQEQAVVGETPNLAARLQALATPGGIVISRRTRRLVGGLFELTDLGPQHLKGFNEPIAVWRVEGEGHAEGRFEALHGERLTPLVGREHELGILLERWAWAKDGDGQMVLLSGEPGIGKSRVVRSLIERAEGEPHMRLRYYCSPYHTNTALYSVAKQLERGAGFLPDDDPEAKLDKLEAVLADATDDLAEAVALIAGLLSIPTSPRYPSVKLTPEMQKARTFEVLLNQLAGLAASRPVLMVLEDAHWIDPTTSELFGLVIDRIRHLPVLLLITFRPEFAPPWAGYAHATPLTLSRLGQRQGAQMVERLTGSKPLPAEVLSQILAKTDGVPLFVEELTKTVLESALLADAGDHFELSGPLPSLAIPATLHDSLMARLDRLAPVKEIAQTAAVIGREFSHNLLAAVSLLSDSDLEPALEHLVTSELIFRRGTPPEATYSFKHALVQDAAYESLLKSRRHQLHARIAAVLEKQFPDAIATAPEVLAHHLSQAGLHGRAVQYWRRAGEIAVRRSANIEAIAHFSKALEALETQPSSRARSEQELALQMAIAVPLAATKGNAGIEVERAYSRAQALCEVLDRRDELFLILRGLWNFYLARGQLERAYDLAARISAEAEQHEGPLQRGLAHRALGSTLFFLGRFAEALDETDQAIAIDDMLEGSVRDRNYWFRYGERPGIISRLYAGWALWFLGFPDRAVAHFDAALALAEKLGYAHSRAFALTFAASMRNNRRDFATALEYADAASRIAAKHDLPLWLGESAVAKGYAEANLGYHAEGIGRLRSGIARLHKIGDWHHRTHWLGLLAAAYLEAGAYGDALAALHEAQEVVAATHERYYAPELERLRGALLTRQGKFEEAGSCFEKALRSAADMGAKSLELRAAMSLARLWRDQGKRPEAYDLLAPVYGWFTEGFDTPDLIEARQLLEQLG